MLVGPSGCGKTTALRMVAGLEVITEGEIRIGDRVVNGLPPRDRDVAMVFQNYALYPHKTVYDNLAFPLKLRKLSRRGRSTTRVRRIAQAARARGAAPAQARASSRAGSASGWRWAGRSSASRRPS